MKEYHFEKIEKFMESRPLLRFIEWFYREIAEPIFRVGFYLAILAFSLYLFYLIVMPVIAFFAHLIYS